MSKKNNERLQKNFKQVKVMCNNKRGYRYTYEYVGDYYQYQFGNLDTKRIKTINVVLILLFAGLFSFLLTRPLQSNNTIYVGMTSMFSIIPALFCIVGIFNFIFTKKSMTIFEYREVRTSIFYGALALFILLVLTTIGNIFFVITQNSANVTFEILKAIGFAICSILIYPLVIFHQKKCYLITYSTNNN